MVIYTDGTTLREAHSDEGVFIRGGFPEALYVSATDPISENRTYEETDIKIDADEKSIAYDILVGGIE